jgi:bifunctional enzyme Fae/Hps
MLNRKKRYLQIALNSTASEAREIIDQLPASERILIEAGTPFIKSYGIDGIRRVKDAWQSKIGWGNAAYVVADTKCIDRGKTEVEIAKQGGASAATVMGGAPIATIEYFIASSKEAGIDSMVDMMGVDQPIKVLRRLKKMPTVVILHRGVDEELFDKHTPIPYIQINKVRSSFDTLIAIAGGDTIREVQRAIFNDANIVVVWKEFYSSSGNTGNLAEEFLKEIK